ncbi:hypothetical protein NA57DRAFT_53825 [Rhizodiscina lignyota]|uniref:Uncharacterized protein n=1 Tax=Rhizodiscina lignyota TaxID=1504668 RepID=A0A9P4IIS3_9PEZI|nr:hypothetical protein NA57DRAFT_53825 [Rhizodiscina lignyota]
MAIREQEICTGTLRRRLSESHMLPSWSLNPMPGPSTPPCRPPEREAFHMGPLIHRTTPSVLCRAPLSYSSSILCREFKNPVPGTIGSCWILTSITSRRLTKEAECRHPPDLWLLGLVDRFARHVLYPLLRRRAAGHI